ncbi:TraB domain-containing protein, partial [Dufourea novaeangliae]
NSSAQTKSDNQNHDISALSHKEYDPSIDERLPETVTLLTTPKGAKLYLVGTVHFSVESQNDVSTIIQAVQPHIVVVELCKARIGILQLNEETMYKSAKNVTYQTIVDTLKTHGTYHGLFRILLLRMVARISKQLGMAPGGEFRRAFEEAKSIPNCIIQLADRPFDITITRAVRSLSWRQTLKIGWHLINLKGDISKEYVEVCKKKHLLGDVTNKLKEEFPVIEQVFMAERDLYLTYSLQGACELQHILSGTMPLRIVGIVGIGHIAGITKHWGKVKSSDIAPIMRVPPQSLSTKILKFTIKVSLLSAVIYAGYKILPMPSGISLQCIRSSVEGLLKVSGDN